MDKTERDEVSEPTPETPEGHERAARMRAERCGREVAAVCERHNCRIVPFLNQPEPVGDGSKVLLSASYGIIPNL